jgi:hypothetical protein
LFDFLEGPVNRILRFLHRNSFLLVAIAFVLVTAASTCHADSAAKHARKIEKHLAKYRAGTLVQVDFRDNSEALGSLGGLSDATFQITNSDSNKLQTFNYADVSSVKRTKEYIGAGSESRHHIRLWKPIVFGAVAAGGGIAAYEATR